MEPESPVGPAEGRGTARLAYLWAAAGIVLAAVAVATVGRQVGRARTVRLGSIAVTSDPTPAEVRLDGCYAGLTPLSIASVGAGCHTVEVWRQGFRRDIVRIEAGAGPESLHVRLEAEAPGALSVHSTPEGAEVILDGQSRGNTPLELDGVPAGQYHIMLRKAGHEMWASRVEVRPGERNRAEAVLENTTLKYLRGAVASNPADLPSWTALGHYLACEGMDNESVDAFERGLELCLGDGVDQEAANRLFQTIARQMNWPGQDRTEFRRRIGEVIAKLADRAIADPSAVGRLATVLERSGRQTELVALYRKACRVNGGKDLQLVRQGFAAAVRVRDSEAAEEIAGIVRRAVSGEPGAEIRVELAEVVMQNWGRYEDKKRPLALAAELYGEAAKGAKSGSRVAVTAYSGLARVRIFSGDSEGAAAAYAEGAGAARKVNDLRRWAELEVERGAILLKLDRKSEAREVFANIVKDAPPCSARDRAGKELDKLPAPPPPPPAPPGEVSPEASPNPAG